MTVRFPAGFIWGTATAAYQVEGAVNADGRGPSIWDTFSHTPWKTYHGDTGDVADDQYNRLDADLDLMADLGLTGHRFSVSWPRIQPDGTGRVNERGLDYYRRVVDGLLQRGITPALTLYHWDLPQALQDSGGWTNRETAQRFAEYAGIVFEALGDRVPLWITLNEPWVAAFAGYEAGAHAPGVQDTAAAVSAAHHLTVAHGLALERMRSGRHPEAKIGITLNLSPVRPASGDPADVAAARRFDGTHNRIFLDPIFRGIYPRDVLDHYRSHTAFEFVEDRDLEIIGRPVDFLGVNYYYPHTVGRDQTDPQRGARSHDQESDRTAMGWPIDPGGLSDLLLRLHRDYWQGPMYITENGAAFYDYPDPEGRVKDPERIAYLDAHFRAAHGVIGQGVDLRGYFVWSFLDNFEWSFGYSKRFGLVYVDYPTQRRIPKESAVWYRGVSERNGVE